MDKPGRNDPCPCGSGKKYKKCCELKATPKKKFQAQILTNQPSAISSLFGRVNPPTPKPPAEPPPGEDRL